MPRILIVTWNPDRADGSSKLLRRAGYDVVVFAADQSSHAYRTIRDDPPNVFIVDLDRRPAHGREVGTWIRQAKNLRHVPIVFVSGETEKVARVRDVLPDATYTEWRRIRGALRQALIRPPAKPIVPDTMGTYAQSPLPKKLGIKPGLVLMLLGAPRGFERKLGSTVGSVQIKRRPRGLANLIMLFVKSQAELKRRLPAANCALAERGAIWIAWPKQALGVASDLTQTLVRKIGLASRLVDYKVCAIDKTWSSLRFARRKKGR